MPSTADSRPASATAAPTGYLTFTLHAHLPYVVNHGTWPHGIEWLHEAAAETYLPLLRVLDRLHRDGIALRCNLNLSPVLLEQLAHPVFRAEFPHYVERKIVAAREDEAYFVSTNEQHYADSARFWHNFFSDALHDFEALGRDIVAGFRRFHQLGLIEIITCGATHGYLPLLGTDESVRAQVRTAVQTHQRHIGQLPRGIWVPECGYRPDGFWNYPVPNADGSPAAPGFHRIGVEQALSESGLDYFFVDTHLVEHSAPVASPYQLMREKLRPHEPAPAAAYQHATATLDPDPSLYQPYSVDGPYLNGAASPIAVFPRDPRTGVQVWSGDSGYPGDPNYLDFHKKRWPGGHRYWRVTGNGVDMNDKQPYSPLAAADRIREHASHFVHLVWQTLQHDAATQQHDTTAQQPSAPPVLCAPFDAELFGHWWFEGPLWLEQVARILHDYPTGLQLTTASDYLRHHPPAGFIAMPEGSWGAEGTNHVWMNPDTSWTYTHIYTAELYVREVCSEGAWSETPLAKRIVQQMCRELLLLESSDWQFLITTGAARDYAELRFQSHNEQFLDLKGMWQAFELDGALNEHQMNRLAAIEERDSIFPDIDPEQWATP